MSSNANDAVDLKSYIREDGSCVIPEGVTAIKRMCFKDCPQLTKITLPSTLTSIKYGAFLNCPNLTEITFPPSLISIEDYAFQNCPGLTEIALPSELILLGNYAFASCDGLSKITIPPKLASIGVCSFSCCESLTEMTLQSGSTAIDKWAFDKCVSLTRINLPSGLISFGHWTAFRGCENVLNIVVNSDDPEEINRIKSILHDKGMKDKVVSKRIFNKAKAIQSEHLNRFEKAVFDAKLNSVAKLSLEQNSPAQNSDMAVLFKNSFYSRKISLFLNHADTERLELEMDKVIPTTTEELEQYDSQCDRILKGFIARKKESKKTTHYWKHEINTPNEQHVSLVDRLKYAELKMNKGAQFIMIENNDYKTGRNARTGRPEIMNESYRFNLSNSNTVIVTDRRNKKRQMDNEEIGKVILSTKAALVEQSHPQPEKCTDTPDNSAPGCIMS